MAKGFRVIDGAVFKRVSKGYFKGAAQKKAANLRDKTHRARVYKERDGYGVYVEYPHMKPSELKRK